MDCKSGVTGNWQDADIHIIKMYAYEEANFNVTLMHTYFYFC